MKFQTPLIKATLIKRYKRFLADVLLEDGAQVTAHCANSGSMMSVNLPGAEVWVSPANNPNRKLKYTWEMIRVNRSLVGINTQHPNTIVAEAISAGNIPTLSSFKNIRREVKYGKNSRIDLLLEMQDGQQCYVEVKNVTMRRDFIKGAPAEFPDGITARGAKHLVELSDMVMQGHRAVMFYLVQRSDVDSMTIARDIDAAYADALDKAKKIGVEVVAFNCKVTTKAINVSRSVEFLA